MRSMVGGATECETLLKGDGDLQGTLRRRRERTLGDCRGHGPPVRSSRVTRAVALPFLALVLVGGCLGPPRQTFDASPAVGAPTRLGEGGTEDEDPAVVRTSDGRFRVVWWSKRNGQVDLFTR